MCPAGREKEGDQKWAGSKMAARHGQVAWSVVRAGAGMVQARGECTRQGTAVLAEPAQQQNLAHSTQPRPAPLLTAASAPGSTCSVPRRTHPRGSRCAARSAQCRRWAPSSSSPRPSHTSAVTQETGACNSAGCMVRGTLCWALGPPAVCFRRPDRPCLAGAAMLLSNYRTSQLHC